MYDILYTSSYFTNFLTSMLFLFLIACSSSLISSKLEKNNIKLFAEFKPFIIFFLFFVFFSFAFNFLLIFDKFNYLIKQIECLDDADNFGTSSTYADFKNRVKQVESIGRDYDLLMKFNNMSIAILGYLDPKNTEYTRMDVKEADWKELVKKYVVACREKSIQYFQDKGSLFNSTETLETRSENINNTAALISHSLLSDLNLMAKQKEK